MNAPESCGVCDSLGGSYRGHTARYRLRGPGVSRAVCPEHLDSTLARMTRTVGVAANVKITRLS